MEDRLIATESLSQGARGICFAPDIVDEFCMRQIAKMQYRCYYISKLDSSIYTPVYYTGNKALDRLAGYAALCQGGPEYLLRLRWQTGRSN